MSLQKILSLSLFSWLKGSTEASLAQSRELTSVHLFHLQGLSWTTSRCPSSSSSSFVVPLYGSSVILLPAFSHVFIPHAQRLSSKVVIFHDSFENLRKKLNNFTHYTRSSIRSRRFARAKFETIIKRQLVDWFSASFTFYVHSFPT